MRCVVGGRVVGVERLDRVDHLVGLLEQVAASATGGSARCPTGTARAACARARGSARSSAPTGAASSGIHSEVRWSASTVRSSSAHVVVDDPLVGRCRGAGGSSTGSSARRAVDGELDVGQHPVGVGVGDEQRAALARPPPWRSRGRRRAARRPRRDRCRAAPRPRRGTTSPAARRSSMRVASSTQHARTVRSSTSGEPGTAYRTSPCSAAAATSAVDDLGVDVVERVGGLVEVVERGGIGRRGRRDGWRGGAQEAVRSMPLDGRSSVSAVTSSVAGRPEADDDDRGRSCRSSTIRAALRLASTALTRRACVVDATPSVRTRRRVGRRGMSKLSDSAGRRRRRRSAAAR